MKAADVIFTDNSDKVLKAKDEAVARILEIIGLKAEGYAKLKAPTDTGLLKNSITHAVGGQSTAISKYHGERESKYGKKGIPFGSYSGGSVGDSSEKAVYIGSNVEYAPYVEYGTQRSRAQPFLKPAVSEHIGEYKSIIENELKNA